MNTKIIFIKGPTGSGKTTMAHLIAALANKVVVFESWADCSLLTGGEVVIFEGWPRNLDIFDFNWDRMKLVIVVLQDGHKIPEGYLCMEMQRS